VDVLRERRGERRVHALVDRLVREPRMGRLPAAKPAPASTIDRERERGSPDGSAGGQRAASWSRAITPDRLGWARRTDRCALRPEPAYDRSAAHAPDSSQRPRLVKPTITTSMKRCERIARRWSSNVVSAAVVGEREAAHVAGDERDDLHGPDRPGRQERVVHGRRCGPEDVRAVAERVGGERDERLALERTSEK
jgi:hypothetical protein